MLTRTDDLRMGTLAQVCGPRALMDDLIVDVCVEGKVLRPADIPAAVQRQIDAARAHGAVTGEVVSEGVRYQWITRPCVYP